MYQANALAINCGQVESQLQTRVSLAVRTIFISSYSQDYNGARSFCTSRACNNVLVNFVPTKCTLGNRKRRQTDQEIGFELKFENIRCVKTYSIMKFKNTRNTFNPNVICL